MRFLFDDSFCKLAEVLIFIYLYFWLDVHLRQQDVACTVPKGSSADMNFVREGPVNDVVLSLTVPSAYFLSWNWCTNHSKYISGGAHSAYATAHGANLLKAPTNVSRTYIMWCCNDWDVYTAHWFTDALSCLQNCTQQIRRLYFRRHHWMWCPAFPLHI